MRRRRRRATASRPRVERASERASLSSSPMHERERRRAWAALSSEHYNDEVPIYSSDSNNIDAMTTSTVALVPRSSKQRMRALFLLGSCDLSFSQFILTWTAENESSQFPSPLLPIPSRRVPPLLAGGIPPPKSRSCPPSPPPPLPPSL